MFLKNGGQSVVGSLPTQKDVGHFFGFFGERCARHPMEIPCWAPVPRPEVVRCQANVPGAAENGRGYPDPPQDMELAQICRAAKEGFLCVDEVCLSFLSFVSSLSFFFWGGGGRGWFQDVSRDPKDFEIHTQHAPCW